VRLVAALVALFAGSGCMFLSCSPQVLQQGTCSAAGDPAMVGTLELGGPGDPFQPLADGDTIMRQIGGQGATMIVVRLRVTGGNQPACLAQSTHVESAADGGTVGQSSVALLTTLQPDGTRTTGQLLLPGYYPESSRGIFVTTQAGGQTVTRALSVDIPGYFDFAPAPDLTAPVEDLAGTD
jgi:hypothetical protein